MPERLTPNPGVALTLDERRKYAANVTAAEVNAERIEAIITEYAEHHRWDARAIARKIVEELDVLRPAQQESLADGSTRTIAKPLPWARP